MHWAPIVIGFIVLFGPTLYDLFTGTWTKDENFHGPVVLGISIWLLYRGWGAMEAASAGQSGSLWGWPVVLLGIVFYAVGRSQMIGILEVGSAIWLLAGSILILRGWKALKSQWFALFFMLFMVPLPAQVVDLVTMPMKMAVSYVAENILYAVGYPIGRNGVVLQIGQYMLLVADACAGLHTLLTLEALGLLYLNLVRRDSLFRNLTLAILIVPISFTANVIRVIALSLITFHFGNEAGQGFLHGFAGMVLFLSALLLIISFDTFLQWIEGFRRRPISTALGGSSKESPKVVNQVWQSPAALKSLAIRHRALLLLMVGCAAVAHTLKPTTNLADERAPIDLATMIPSQFGTWREQLNLAVQIIDPELQVTVDEIYTETLTRNYIDSRGYRIMLSIAYGKNQSDNLQLHKPEVCYPAQGFKLDNLYRTSLDLAGQNITATRMDAHLGTRFEPVTYWTVVGDHITTGGINKKITEMRYGMRGRIPDGMLVRVSSIDRNTELAHQIQAEFAAAMIAAIAPEHRSRFAGLDPEPNALRTTTP